MLQAISASTIFDVLARLGLHEEGLSKAAHYSPSSASLWRRVRCKRVLGLLYIKNRAIRSLALYHGLVHAALIGSCVLSLCRPKNHRADGERSCPSPRWGGAYRALWLPQR